MKAHNRALPPAVSLQELIAKGFLKHEDISALEGMEVTVSLTADETRPQKKLIEARLADGTTIVVLSDGSASMLPAK